MLQKERKSKKNYKNQGFVWPSWLEDAFLDALLLIPHCGRKSFVLDKKAYGLNVLITELCQFVPGAKDLRSGKI
ncbi:hypothetical protein GGR57DRAFT_508088 [Xylariaceae sp. FL1272]|nr:hypothetical protein GGR57DRAFT_508088 [Xylariaceae sp. FL1272]